jgi:hypothetical protein
VLLLQAMISNLLCQLLRLAVVHGGLLLVATSRQHHSA